MMMENSETLEDSSLLRLKKPTIAIFFFKRTRLMLMGDGEGRTDKIVVNFGEASIWSQSKWLTEEKSELEIMKYLSIVYYTDSERKKT